MNLALLLTLVVAPLRLHPRDPHLFEFRGKPTVLVGSTEHYGAVLNLDFDFAPYLDELKANHLNLTRVFSGAYIEDGKAFGITHNTLAPRPARYLAPWARSKTPGKFDLARWEPAYFRRLKDFVREAGRRGIVVEVVLFCPFYDDSQWALSPMNARNNVNDVGAGPRTDAYTMKDQGLQAFQEALVRKVVTELDDLDNVYFEICNEPYFGGVTLDWQRRIADVIALTEKRLPNRHLVAQNIANGTAKVSDVHPAVSILNFHYGTPPAAVADNWGLGRAVGDDETGFRGTGDDAYRTEGWDFLLAGGAIYDNLDYSFTVDAERGTARLGPREPGGGGPALRRQLRALVDFLGGLDLPALAPAPAEALRLSDERFSARALVNQARDDWAAYVRPRIGRSTDYAVRWSGFVDPPAAGTYTFTVVANDGARLWIDDLPLIDAWTGQSDREASAQVTLPARRVPIRIEFQQREGGAQARLSWTPPGGSRQVVPAARLAAPDGAAGGLRGEYFVDHEWRTKTLVRTDPGIDFDWRTTSPFVEPVPADRESRVQLALDLPAGRYRVAWIDTRKGAAIRSDTVEHAGGTRTLDSPPFVVDVALRVARLR